MVKPLLSVVAIGAAIGLAWPSAKPAPAPVKSGEKHETVLKRDWNGHFYVNAKVNGQPIRFVVDTGASAVALTQEDALRAGIQFSPSEFTEIGEGASGAVRGEHVTISSVDIDGKKVDHVTGVILADSNLSLLGQSYLSRMGEVDMEGDYMVLR